MKKQKVGIVTLPGNFNYGNRLQNYAVSQVYESRGFKSETLILSNRPNALRDLKQTVRKIIGKPFRHPEDSMSKERLKAFQKFNKNMCVNTVDISGLAPDDYVFFSVGSDQVWNPNCIRYDEDWFFLISPRKSNALRWLRALVWTR